MFLCRYQQGFSKNYFFDSNHCASEDFRPAVNVYVTDVINTYKALMLHRPILDGPGPHPIFLSPKTKLKLDRDLIWFSKVPVGRNTLGLLTKRLTEDIPEFIGKKITNKSGRGTAVTRLTQAMVPIEYGMRVTGHRNSKSYSK